MDKDNDYDAKIEAQNPHRVTLEDAQIVSELEAEVEALANRLEFANNKLSDVKSNLAEELLSASWWFDLENIGFSYADTYGVTLHIPQANGFELEQKYGVKLTTIIGG